MSQDLISSAITKLTIEQIVWTVFQYTELSHTSQEIVIIYFKPL